MYRGPSSIHLILRQHRTIHGEALIGNYLHISRHTAQKQLAEKEGVTEQLKAENQMLWVKRMNNIRNRATEIVNAELIYT